MINGLLIDPMIQLLLGAGMMCVCVGLVVMLFPSKIPEYMPHYYNHPYQESGTSFMSVRIALGFAIFVIIILVLN